MSRYTGAVLKELDRVFNEGTIAGLTEGKLLERFVSGRDEAAFGALVALHGPMVLGICRRILRDETDVEDAFQATFLVLVRRAGAIRRGDLVGHWLYGVAHRVAVRARALAARRRVHEPTGLQAAETHTGSDQRPDGNFELRAILDEELARLPASLRSPVILCYLEGLTHDEAALQLRWPVGTVRSRMARARDLLRRRLVRRGFMADQAALTSAFALQAVPIDWIDRTVRTSLAFSTKPTAATAVASGTATFLAKGVLHAMTISKLKTLGVAVLVAGLTIGGAKTLARQYGGKGQTQKPEAAASAAQDNPRDALLRSVDRVDDLLDELTRRNADVQHELRVLRKEIADLRAAGLSKKASPPAEFEKASPRQPAPELGNNSVTPTRSALGVRTKTAKARETAPSAYEFGHSALVVSPRGDRVAVYNRVTGKNSSLDLPGGGAGYKITPVAIMDMAALDIRGPGITKIAVYVATANQGLEGWYPQDLREAAAVASPVVQGGIVAYPIGGRVYAFSAQTKTWDVLEPELFDGKPPHLAWTDDLMAFKVTSGSHIYTFRIEDGKWRDLDLNAILEGKVPLEKGYVKPSGARVNLE